MIIVRYADDIVVGFEHEADAGRFLEEMRERLQEFALSLHPEKTRLIEFGRFAAAKPESSVVSANRRRSTFLASVCCRRHIERRVTRKESSVVKLRRR